jgi:hypothetical protein
MTRAARRYELAVSAAVVALFAAYWAIALATSKPPEHQSLYVQQFVILMTVLAAPWVIAVRLLWRAWWDRDVAGLAVVDGPAVLLAAAVATLTDDRRDWGRALVSELAHVPGRSARWGFAVGGARTALFPPRSHRLPALAVGVLAAAATWLAVGSALPALRVFAPAFVALVAVMAARAAARPRGRRGAAAGPVIAAAGVAGVVACLAVTAQFLAQHPSAATYLSPAPALVLAAVLAGCLWLATTPPRGLATSRLARGVGVGAAVLLGLGFLLTARLFIHTAGGVMGWVVLAPAAVSFAAAATAAALGRSRRAGVEAAVWAVLLGALLIFAAWLPEAAARHRIDRGLLFDGDGAPIGVNLADAIGGLVLILALGLPFGVIGAAFGADGSLQAIGLKTPRSPALASVLLCLPFAALSVIAGNDPSPFTSWFADDQPLAPVGQSLMLGSVLCLPLALLYALISLSRLVARLVSVLRLRRR